MADQWTIVDADSDTITVSVEIAGATHQWVLSHTDVDMTSAQDLLHSVRDFATAQREALTVARTAPVVAAEAVGYTEVF